MSCSSTVTTDNQVFCSFNFANQDDRVTPAFADSGVLIEKPWFRVHVRKGTKIAVSGLVFLEGRLAASTADFLRLPGSPMWFFYLI